LFGSLSKLEKTASTFALDYPLLHLKGWKNGWVDEWMGSFHPSMPPSIQWLVKSKNLIRTYLSILQKSNEHFPMNILSRISEAMLGSSQL